MNSALVPLVVHGQLAALLARVHKVLEFAQVHVFMRFVIEAAATAPFYIILAHNTA